MSLSRKPDPLIKADREVRRVSGTGALWGHSAKFWGLLQMGRSPTHRIHPCLPLTPASLLHSYTQAGEMCSSKRECPCPRESLCWVCHLIKLQASEATECGVTDFILQMGPRRDASQTSPCSHRARAGEKRVACVRSSPSITPALLHSAFCMRGSIRNTPS